MEEKAFYTPEELAQLLCVDVRTIYNAIKRKELETVHIGVQYRIPAAELKRITIPRDATYKPKNKVLERVWEAEQAAEKEAGKDSK